MQPSPTRSKFDAKYAIAGATLETIVRQPLMAITSVRIKTQNPYTQITKDLLQKGIITGFYSGTQGASIAFLYRTFHRTATFGVNQQMKNNGYNLPTIAVTTAGIETAITMVGEMVVTIAQTQKGTESPLQILANRMKTMGYKTLTTGFASTMGRNTTFNIGYFGLGFFFSDQTKKYPIASAFAAASIGVSMSHPFEVLRVKKVDHPESSYIKIMQDLFRKNGIKWLGSAFIPRAASVGVGGFIAMAVYSKAVSHK